MRDNFGRAAARACFVLAAVIAAAATPARATQIDLSTMTCAQFVASDADEIKLILTWLDAYYKDEDAPPVIDTDKFVDNAKKLGDYCKENSSIGLITATDKLFGK